MRFWEGVVPTGCLEDKSYQNQIPIKSIQQSSDLQAVGIGAVLWQDHLSSDLLATESFCSTRKRRPQKSSEVDGVDEDGLKQSGCRCFPGDCCC